MRTTVMPLSLQSGGKPIVPHVGSTSAAYGQFAELQTSGRRFMERRQDPRWLTFKTGRIRLADAADEIACAILDISAHGACILIPVGAQLQDDFALAVDFTGESLACRICWRSGNRVGVSFQSSIANP